MNKIYNLNDRALLCIEGKDSSNFLQSVITNDIKLLDKQGVIYAAHLNPKGKFLYDFFISKLNDMYIIDCNKAELMDIAKNLHGYVISKDIEFNDLSEDYSCVASDCEINNAVVSYADTRDKNLGFRNWVKDLPENMMPLELYNKKRINLGIIDGAYDGIKSRSLINELNFEALNGVSFKKGCYVGQELTARTKFRTEPKKKVFKVSFKGSAKNGDIIKCGNMEAGWIFSNIGGVGIAIIRTRYLDKALTLNGENIRIIL